MCLAVPVKVLTIDGLKAQVELGGLTYQVSIMLTPEVAVGDYILLHAGFAIQRLDETEAEATICLFEEMHEAEIKKGIVEDSAR